MKAFIDTSSLIKKYVSEGDYEKFDQILEKITQIIISPITGLEINSVLERKIREKSISKPDATLIESNFNQDRDYFGVVNWSERLEKSSRLVIRKYQLKTLDGIQLGSALLAKPDVFITSDKNLFAKAKKEIDNSIFIN